MCGVAQTFDWGQKERKKPKKEPERDLRLFRLFSFLSATSVWLRAAWPNPLIEPKRTKEAEKRNPNETSDFFDPFRFFRLPPSGSVPLSPIL